jgi:hypothetical protein
LHNEGEIFAMHFQPYRFIAPRAAIVALLLATLLALPLASTASAQAIQRQQCAVGLRLDPGYGYANIIRVYGSVSNQYFIQAEAAACSELISQGWFGVSKYGEWEHRYGGAYWPICRYDWPWGGDALVYALPGSEWAARLDCYSFTDGYLGWF